MWNTAFKKIEVIWCGLLKQTIITLIFFKDCIPQILIGPCMNTLSHMLVLEICCVAICSRWQVFYRITVLENFPIFTWKHLWWSLFFKLARSAILLRRTLLHVFSCEFCKIFRKGFFTELLPSGCGMNIFSHNLYFWVIFL